MFLTESFIIIYKFVLHRLIVWKVKNMFSNLCWNFKILCVILLTLNTYINEFSIIHYQESDEENEEIVNEKQIFQLDRYTFCMNCVKYSNHNYVMNCNELIFCFNLRKNFVFLIYKIYRHF